MTPVNNATPVLNGESQFKRNRNGASEYKDTIQLMFFFAQFSQLYDSQKFNGRLSSDRSSCVPHRGDIHNALCPGNTIIMKLSYHHHLANLEGLLDENAFFARTFGTFVLLPIQDQCFESSKNKFHDWTFRGSPLDSNKTEQRCT